MQREASGFNDAGECRGMPGRSGACEVTSECLVVAEFCPLRSAIKDLKRGRGNCSTTLSMAVA